MTPKHLEPVRVMIWSELTGNCKSLDGNDPSATQLNVVAPVPDSSVADGQRSYLTSHMFALTA